MKFRCFTMLICLQFLVGCKSNDSISKIGSAGDLDVLTESKVLQNYNTGGSTDYRYIIIKFNGNVVSSEEISKKLFPQNSPCHSPFYQISDIRILQDRSLIALFSDTQGSCGAGQLAKIWVRDGQFNVERIHIGNNGTRPNNWLHAGSATTAIFGYVIDQKVVYGYSSTSDALQAQRRSQGGWTFLASLLGEGALNTALAYESQHAFAINLNDGRLIDLGLGNVFSVVADGDIALIHHETLSNAPLAHAQYRAVQLSTGTVLDTKRLQFHCFQSTGEQAIARQQYNLQMIEDDDKIVSLLRASIENDRKVLGLAPSIPNNEETPQQRKLKNKLIAHNLTIAKFMEPRGIIIDWDGTRLNIKASGQLLEKPNCSTW